MAERVSLRTGRPPTMATNGMIATPHYLATEAGNHILQQGGSAIDAAIAANAVLAVVYPHMAALGGDCFWLIWSAREGRLLALNGSGRSAQKATIDFYRSKGHSDEIPSRGPLAANTVPGAVDGWHEAHQRLGKVEWARLFERAIQYADEGAPVPGSTASWLEEDRDILNKYSPTAEIFLPGGRVPQLGERLVQKNLAQSFRTLAKGARDAFYRGEIAQEITRHLQENGGVLTMDDFENHHSDWVQPIKTVYRGVEVATFPPNTQGLALLLILNVLQGYDMRKVGDGTADYVHAIVETTKLAFADRDRWVTDPNSIDVPFDQLLSPNYADKRRQQVNMNRAHDPQQVQAGQIGGLGPGLQGQGPGIRMRPVGGDTIYLCATDRDGNAVSLIMSIYHDFGSAIVGGNTGIILQNRGSFFSLDPDDVNHLEPNKRTFHTLMPSMMLKDGRPHIVFGTMGGEGQPQTQAVMVTKMLDFGYNVQQAIEAPRWLYGRAWGEQELNLKMEGRFPREVVEELRQRGHDVEVEDDYTEMMGHAQAIHIDHDSGVMSGGADPRGDGAAMGW
jgi:oxamate amidohydrolase